MGYNSLCQSIRGLREHSIFSGLQLVPLLDHEGLAVKRWVGRSHIMEGLMYRAKECWF